MISENTSAITALASSGSETNARTLLQQNRMAYAVAEVAATADLHPGVTIIHNILTDSVEYMSRQGMVLLQTTLPALRAMGPEYHKVFFNPTDVSDYLPKILEMAGSSDPWAMVSFFQQVRTTQSPEYSWYFSLSRVLLRDTDGSPLLLITTACPIDPLHHVTHKVSRLLEENNFLRQHSASFSTLTAREREVLRRLALGLSAPEIAAELFLSAATVETHRRNLRRKLGIRTSYELTEYARAFDLI
ncbi:response regulator transcription factor [Hymenobacter sp. B1770]|uniref:response regulator transcription factor n=1 Tax=Hymenobacter sp. B1770 TaxID=1718788 RepID=UPI003CF16C8D